MLHTQARPRLHALARAVSWHRRKLAVVAAVAAVLTGISAAMPADPPSVEVVTAATRLDGGTVLADADVTTVRLPEAVVPEGALTRVADAVGQTLTASVSSGQPLTDLALVPAGRSGRAGMVVAPLRLADTDLAALLHVGDAVDVVAADGQAKRAVVVARSVRVVGLPRAADASGIGGTDTSSGGALVLVEVGPVTATALAQAAVTSTLSVVFR